MEYEKEAPYPFYSHMPYAKEPLRSLYVGQRLFTTLALVPYWVLYYSLVSRSERPRESWSLKQIVNVNFTRRIYKVVEVAGFTWGTRDPSTAPNPKSLKETRFEWVPPLEEELRKGIVLHNKERVRFEKVGVFIWPKVKPEYTDDESKLIGVYFHGGGYCQMSAHENSRTSNIPRRLMKEGLFHEIYSVEYRLLQYAPFPAVIQDAAAVYAHLVKTHGDKARIVLIGDSSGGNLALALARWIRDERMLPPPTGLLLLSPSCDPSHALPETMSSYVPRPHASTDYLVDTPEPRALLQRTFLGFHYHPIRLTEGLPQSEAEVEEERRLMEIVHSEYVSPTSPRVLKRWAMPVEHDPNREGEAEFLENVPPELASTRIPTSGLLETDIHQRRKYISLFGDFPKTLVIVGDAERLENEVKSLITAMEKDGVDVQSMWVKDAVHDVLIMAPGWWDEKVRDGIWEAVGKWTQEIR